MSDVTLENVLSVNEELAALCDAGFPVRLDTGNSQDEVAETLKRANNSLSLRSRLGQPLSTATIEDQELPALYRSALEAGLRGNQLTGMLDGLSREATADNALRSTIGRSLLSPLIVLFLAYCGFMVLCLGYSPALEGMYEQVGQIPSLSSRILIFLRDTLPYWAILVPLFLLGCVTLWRRGWGNPQRWIPGAKRYSAAVRNSNFANQLRLLVENDVPLVEATPLAAAVTGDPKLMAAAEVLSSPMAMGKKASADSPELRTLPPMLRWALTADLGDQSLPEVLRFVEHTYRQSAERRAATWRVVLPATIGALLGGGVVLLYGLSLFGPYSRLLRDLAG